MKKPRDTRTRILDNAEELFSERGIDRVSVRDITTRARANHAAINYYFGSKENLIAAVFERRVLPVNEARLAALDELEKQGGRSPKVEAILEAFIRPAVESVLKTTKGKAAFHKLFGRCLSEANPVVDAQLRKQFEPLIERMDAALMRALPHLSQSEIFWRMKFTFGALHHWLLTREKCIPGWVDGSDLDQQMRRLITYAAAGLRAG